MRVRKKSKYIPGWVADVVHASSQQQADAGCRLERGLRVQKTGLRHRGLPRSGRHPLMRYSSNEVRQHGNERDYEQIDKALCRCINTKVRIDVGGAQNPNPLCSNMYIMESL